MEAKERIVIDSMEVEVEEFPWGELKWLWSNKIIPNAEQTFGLVRINPGQKNATHIHGNCEELLYVLSGECEHGIGDGVVVANGHKTTLRILNPYYDWLRITMSYNECSGIRRIAGLVEEPVTRLPPI